MVAFTNHTFNLPEHIDQDIGTDFEGPWTNGTGEASFDLDNGTPAVVNFNGTGLKGIDFSPGGGAKWELGSTENQPTLVTVVIDNWTSGFVFDGFDTSSLRHALYQQGSSPVSAAFAGANLSTLPGTGARDGNPHVVRILFNGVNSFQQVGSDIFFGDVGSQSFNGLTIGQAFNGSSQGNMTIAGLVASTVDLEGETNLFKILTACIAHDSAILYPVFGNMSGLIDPRVIALDSALGTLYGANHADLFVPFRTESDTVAPFIGTRTGDLISTLGTSANYDEHATYSVAQAEFVDAYISVFTGQPIAAPWTMWFLLAPQTTGNKRFFDLTGGGQVLAPFVSSGRWTAPSVPTSNDDTNPTYFPVAVEDNLSLLFHGNRSGAGLQWLRDHTDRYLEGSAVDRSLNASHIGGTWNFGTSSTISPFGGNDARLLAFGRIIGEPTTEQMQAHRALINTYLGSEVFPSGGGSGSTTPDNHRFSFSLGFGF